MEGYKQLNGLALAYVGDAIHEIYIRDYLVSLGQTELNALHRMVTHYASARTQASSMQAMLTGEMLAEEEEVMYKHGRNVKDHTFAKNADVTIYRVAIGFESSTGYLHLTQQKERLEELTNWCVKKVGETNEK